MSFDLIDQQQAIGNRLSAIDNQCFFFCPPLTAEADIKILCATKFDFNLKLSWQPI